MRFFSSLVESSSRNNSHSCQMKLSLCDDNKDLSQDDALRIKKKRQRKRWIQCKYEVMGWSGLTHNADYVG